MADERLIFPVGFDLDAGVKEAENDWKNIYYKRLQKAIDKTPLKVKLNIDAKGLDLKSLRDYNKLTKEAALAAKRAADVESKRALARQRQSAARVAEATEEARIAKAKAQSEMAQLRLNHAQQNGLNYTNQLNGAYSKQSTYLSRLVQRLGLYFGLRQFAGLIRNIRDITMEFELQRVSLGALIQDAHQADVLFSQIKAAAVESPYQIKDLVNYTKQLAAYGVEQNKLFGTVMQYADVAAGLGADMSRVILAMGQIRAASVLKGTELRQLTELGIPMVDLLSKKLTELRGEFVSTGEVFSMISDKAISFKMVEEIFNDLTSAGGRFYNMQQKQSETLKGQWSNLQDTFSIMFDEIGNTEIVHSTMEDVIADIKSLAQNWELVIGTIGRFAKAMLIAKGVSLFLPIQAVNTRMLKAATDELTAATARYNAVQGKGLAGQSAKWAMNHAIWMQKAATATTLFGRGMKRIAAFFAGGGWLTLGITAITLLVSWLITARKEANRLTNELSKIDEEGGLKMEQSVRNFERLAKIAADSVDGTKEQTDALNELRRSYEDIIPAQELTIENLRKMAGNYSRVTEAIRENVAMQTLEQKISAIEEEYGTDISDKRKELKKALMEFKGWSDAEALRVLSNIEQQVTSGTYAGWADALEKAMKQEVTGTKYEKFGYFGSDNIEMLMEFVSLVSQRESAIREETDALRGAGNALHKYKEWWDEATASFNKAKASINTTEILTNTKLYEETVLRHKVKSYADLLRKVFKEESSGAGKFVTDEAIDFESIFSPETAKYLSVQALNVVRKVQKEIEGFSGWQAHFAEFSRDMKVGGIDRKVFLYTDEEIGNFGNLNTALEETAKRYKELKKESETYGGALKGDINPEEREQISNKKNLVDEQKRQAYEILKTYNALKLIEEKGKDTDDWVQLWKNRAAVMKDFQKGVEDLTKKMGYAKAVVAQAEIMFSRGLQVGIDLSGKEGTAEELIAWYDEQINHLISEIRRLGGKEGFAELSVEAILRKDTKTKVLKEAQELLQWLFNQKTDFQTQNLENTLKKTIDQLAKDVARSKEAKDFYDKMLGMTGDTKLASELTLSVYGGVGEDLQNNIKKQLEKAFEGVDISSAFDGDKIDFTKLEALIPKLPEDLRANAQKLVNEGIKDNAKWLQDLYKTYEKFQTYEERRTIVMKREEQKRREIQASSVLSPEEKQKHIAASEKREAQELDTIDLEEFKASEDWIQTFENIEKVGTKSIQHLMTALEQFIKTNKDLTPEQIKTLMKEYDKLYQGLIARNPLKAIMQGTGQYFVALNDWRKARRSAERKTAKKEEVDAEKEVAAAKKEVKNAVSKEDEAAALAKLAAAEEKLAKAQQKRAKAEAAVRKAQDKSRAALSKVRKGVNESAAAYNALGEIVNGVMETFSVDETSDLGIALKSVSEALTMVAGVLGIINAMITLIESHPLVLAISAGIMAIIGAIMLFKNLKTADAEAKIEEMTKKLEDLEYAYERLEKAQEKAFGSDYIENYNQRMKNLADQQEAYLAQAEAERSKGKEADEEKAKDYEKSAQEVADSIADAQTELSEHFLGTDLTSAARDFAQAWIDAYKEFGSTTDAMKEKFSEMIENMIVESLAAKIVQGQLGEIFDMVDSLSKDGQLSVSDAAHIAEMSKLASENIDVGMTNLMNALEAAGISVRGMGTDLTGISKDIATASEESILGLAAGINTQNFYISQVPPKLDTIIAILQGGANPVAGVNVQDLITIQNQHLAYLPNIATNTLNTADRCERAAIACESALSKISSVISVRGTASSHVVNTN